MNGLKRRYEVGLEKLLAAEADVNIMKQELIELQPKLIETGKEVEETLKVAWREGGEREEKGGKERRAEREVGGQWRQAAATRCCLLRLHSLPSCARYPSDSPMLTHFHLLPLSAGGC